jgi:hypothetical protein
MFIAKREAKLSRLQLELHDQILNVSNFCFQDSENKLIVTVLVQEKFLQRKLDSQLCLVKSFIDLAQIREEEHIKLQTKNLSIKDAWRFASIKLELWE